jgi:hypothetical protein
VTGFPNTSVAYAARVSVHDLKQQLDAMAAMEQVSIAAFVELADQLKVAGAPAELSARCLAAADDDRRHIELLVELGAERPCTSLAPAPSKTSLTDFALHNAVEGCVLDTWAALLARIQAAHAPDERTRRVFERIAADEADHAQLAWDLHVWFVEVLEPSDAAAVEAARARALARLGITASQQALVLPREVREALGLPEPRLASELGSEFGRRLAQRPAA